MILTSRSRRVEERARWTPDGHDAADFGGGSDLERALAMVWSWACIGTIADAVAAAPLQMFRDGATGSEQVPLAEVFAEPDPVHQLTGFEWRYQAAFSLAAHGNAIGLQLNEGPWPSIVRWVDPGRVESRAQPDGTLAYFLGGQRITSPLWHSRRWLRPGSVWGESPISRHRWLVKLGVTAEKFTADYFDSGGTPSGVVLTKAPITQTQADDARLRWREMMRRGRDVAFIGGDATYEAIQSNLKDAAALEASEHVGRLCAAVWGIPGWVLGLPRDSMTYASVEAEWIQFEARTLRFYCTGLEQTYARMIPRGLTVRHNLDAGIRADLLTRMQAHEIAIRSRVRTPNESRGKENLPPETWGEQPYPWPNPTPTTGATTAP